MTSNLDVRPSSIAGQWYSVDPKSLAASVDRYIDSASLPELEGKIIGIMSRSNFYHSGAEFLVNHRIGNYFYPKFSD